MTPKEVKQPLTPTVQLGVVRYSRCGKILAGGAFDGTVRRWDISAAAKELPPLTGHGGWVQALAFHTDGRRLFSGDSWGKLCAWNYADTQAKPLWSITAHDGWLRRVAISPDDQALATCGADRKIRLWSAADGKKLTEFDQKDDTFCVAFHPDGKSLVAGDLHGVVRQWDLASGKSGREFDAKAMFLYERIQEVGGVRSLAFDATGKYLAVGGGQPKSGGFVQGNWLLLIFDWASGKQVGSAKGTTENDGFVLDMLWHADGFVMAATSGQPGNGKLFFLRPADAQPFFSAAKPNCHSLDLSPDGRKLVVAATNANSSGNGRVKGKGDEYPANVSPLHFWEMVKK